MKSNYKNSVTMNSNNNNSDNNNNSEIMNQSIMKGKSSLKSSSSNPLPSSSSSKSYSFNNILKKSFQNMNKKFKKRYIILMMCMMMNALSYTIRTNINITIVAMVKDDNLDKDNSIAGDDVFVERIDYCPNNNFFNNRKLSDNNENNFHLFLNDQDDNNNPYGNNNNQNNTQINNDGNRNKTSDKNLNSILKRSSYILDSNNIEDNFDEKLKKESVDNDKEDNDSKDDLRGIFDWNESLQGNILGAYYWGYIITNFNGGQLSELIGTKRLLTLSMLLSTLLTLLIPFFSFTNAWLVIFNRVLTGLAQGVITPAIYQLLSYWTPRDELGIAFGLIPASGYIGAVVTMPICAFLSEYGWFGGWPSVFYFFGFFGLISLIPWLTLVYDYPDCHPSINDDELKYIKLTSMTSKFNKKKKLSKNNKNNSKNNNNQEKNDDKKCTTRSSNRLVPWKAILLSKKIWAIALTKFCTAWGNLFLMSKLPTYLSQILNLPITYNSYINASIYITLGASMFFWGWIADSIERRKCLGRTTSRKLFETLAMIGSALFMAVIPLFGCDIIPIIIMLNLSMITLGLTAGGDSLIVVDVAPDYSGSIYGMANSFASLPGFLAPLFVGLMLDQPGVDQMQQWRSLFWVAAGIYLLGGFIFIFFTDTKPEPWGKKSSSITSVSSAIKSIDQQQKLQKQKSSENDNEINNNNNNNTSDTSLAKKISQYDSDPLSNTTTTSTISTTTTTEATINSANFELELDVQKNQSQPIDKSKEEKNPTTIVEMLDGNDDKEVKQQQQEPAKKPDDIFYIKL